MTAGNGPFWEGRVIKVSIWPAAVGMLRVCSFTISPLAEVSFDKTVIAQERLPLAFADFMHDAPERHHISALADFRCNADILLDQQQPHAALAQLRDDLQYVLHHFRRET